MDKRVTIRLTDQEIDHCDKMARGDLSFYIRYLIQKDICGDDSQAVQVPVFMDKDEAVISMVPVGEY